MSGMTEKSWNVVAMCALVVLAALAVFDLAVPKPVMPNHHDQVAQKQTLMRTIEIHEKDAAEANADVSHYIWNVAKTDEIGAKSLTSITALAQKHKISLLGFRPQKATVDNGLEHLPYLIILEGNFPGVSGFLNDLENIQTKLAVNMVQIASSEAATDKVNANIGVIAYTKAQETTNAAKK